MENRDRNPPVFDEIAGVKVSFGARMSVK